MRKGGLFRHSGERKRCGKPAVCQVLLLLFCTSALLLIAGCAAPAKTPVDQKPVPKKHAALASLAVDFEPHYGARDVAGSTEVVMRFSEPVADPERAERLFSTEPNVEGVLRWDGPDVLRFTPASGWPSGADVMVTLRGGKRGFRSAGGATLDSNKSTFFTVGTTKTIDVDLTKQTLSLFAAGNHVFTCLISSGKPGYDTPTGSFKVYAKDRVTAMGATPEAREFYYVPDVPFVMWFRGGYSIHGAYWHNEFGRVRSHGCINLSTGDAEYVYGWTPVGTPVNIHY